MKHTILRTLFPAILLLAGSAAKGQQNGLNFDGIDDEMVFSAAGVNAYTIECWVRFTGTSTASKDIIVFTDPGNAAGGTFSNELHTNASGRFVHYTYEGAQKSVTGTTVAALNTWYHVAITAANGGMMRCL